MAHLPPPTNFQAICDDVLDNEVLSLLEPHFRFGDKLLKFQVVCPQIGTAVLYGQVSTKSSQSPNFRSWCLLVVEKIGSEFHPSQGDSTMDQVHTRYIMALYEVYCCISNTGILYQVDRFETAGRQTAKHTYL